jgi:hypothetical protein
VHAVRSAAPAVVDLRRAFPARTCAAGLEHGRERREERDGLRVGHVEGGCVGGGAVIVIGGEGEIDDGCPADFDDVRVDRDVRLRVSRLAIALTARRGRTPTRAPAERLVLRPAGAREQCPTLSAPRLGGT